jgi:hypothetical protein
LTLDSAGPRNVAAGAPAWWPRHLHEGVLLLRPAILNHLSSLIFTDWNQRPSVFLSGSKPVRFSKSLRLRRSRARKPGSRCFFRDETAH